MAIEESWPQQVQHLIAQRRLDPAAAIENADRVMQREFIYDHPYDMEPTNVVYHMDPITWQQTPNGDPEWLYMLKRQEYLLDLLLASQAQDDPKYLADAKTLIIAWIDANLTLPKTWRTIDTGIRLMNWAPVVEALMQAEMLTAADQAKIQDAVTQQMAYLRAHFTDHYLLSNWGVLIVTGPLVYGVLHPGSLTAEDMQWAMQELETMCDLQITDDGVHWEQSALYFLEVWRDLLAVQIAFDRYRRPVPELVTRKLLAMDDFAAQYVLPNHQLLQVGDSDAVQIDSLIQTANMCLHRTTPLTPHMAPMLDYLLVSIGHLSHFHLTDFNYYPIHKVVDSPASGNYFGRSSWESDADYWHVINGNIGSGHGHANLGHFDLVLGGQSVVVDPGRYTYVDSPERRALKDAAAHNTVLLNGENYDPPTDSWSFQSLAEPQAGMVFHGPGLSVVTSIYRVAPAGGTPGTITRQFIWLTEEHTWIALDSAVAAGENQMTIPLNFAPELTVTAQGAGHWQAGSTTIISHAAGGTVSDELYSPKYNQLGRLQRLTLTQDFTDHGFNDLVIAPTGIWQDVSLLTSRQAGNTSAQVVDPRYCYGVRLTTPRGDKLYVVWQKENTTVGDLLYFVDDIPVFGNLTVIRQDHTGQISRQIVRL